jgi:hypothetical protein
MTLPEIHANPLLRLGEFSPISMVLLVPSAICARLIEAAWEQSPNMPRNGAAFAVHQTGGAVWPFHAPLLAALNAI